MKIFCHLGGFVRHSTTFGFLRVSDSLRSVTSVRVLPLLWVLQTLIELCDHVLYAFELLIESLAILLHLSLHHSFELKCPSVLPSLNLFICLAHRNQIVKEPLLISSIQMKSAKATCD